MKEQLDNATVQAIASQIASLLERRESPDQFLTAGQVAARFNVTREWVYRHAHELGVVRLTDSRHARLRFDPAVVAHRLLTEEPDETPPPAPFVAGANRTPLLPIRGRSLDDRRRRRSA